MEPAEDARRHARRVTRHYDELDPFYRDIWGEHLHHGLWRGEGDSVQQATRRLVRLVGDRAKIRGGHRVCDVGSGYGAPARFLARRYGCTVVGITLSPKQIQHARRENDSPGNPRFVLGNWLENGFPANGFDRVISIECVSHVADRVGFFKEVRRVLKPGGRLVICAWLKSGSVSRWQQRWLIDPIRRTGRLASLSTVGDYRGWFKEAGLVLESFEELGDRVRRTWWVGMKRLMRRLLEDRRYRQFLFDSSRQSRGFALSLPRLWMAYRLGVMDYGVFEARTPPVPGR